MGSGVNRTAAMVALAVVAVAVGAGLGSMGNVPPGGPTDSLPTVVAASSVEVHVAGWVESPGVVAVPEGSLVATAIEAAGGFRPGALTEQINLAAEVVKGEQIVVPGPDEGHSSDGGVETGLISLNRADVGQLEQLPGVGPVLAERIIAHRESNGPFRQVEDLLEVPGIGEAKLAAIRDLVRP